MPLISSPADAPMVTVSWMRADKFAWENVPLPGGGEVTVPEGRQVHLRVTPILPDGVTVSDDMSQEERRRLMSMAVAPDLAFLRAVVGDVQGLLVMQPGDLGALASLHSLRVLQLFQVTDAALASLEVLPMLSRLDEVEVMGGALGDEHTATLLQCKQLRKIRMRGTAMTAQGLAQLLDHPGALAELETDVELPPETVTQFRRAFPGILIDGMAFSAAATTKLFADRAEAITLTRSLGAVG